MEGYGKVKGKVNRKYEIEKAKGIKECRLNRCKERFTAHYIWIPQGELAVFQAVYPCCNVWMEKNRQVPFNECIIKKKDIIKI